MNIPCCLTTSILGRRVDKNPTRYREWSLLFQLHPKSTNPGLLIGRLSPSTLNHLIVNIILTRRHQKLREFEPLTQSHTARGLWEQQADSSSYTLITLLYCLPLSSWAFWGRGITVGSPYDETGDGRRAASSEHPGGVVWGFS